MQVVPLRPDVETGTGVLSGQQRAPAMIEIESVSQRFEISGRKSHLALSDINLTVEDGAFVSILGPSGCGKSTLLYIVGGFVNPTQGVAKVKGTIIKGPGPDRGPVFQEFALFPWKTVLGNVMYGLRQQGVKRAEVEAQSHRLSPGARPAGLEVRGPKPARGVPARRHGGPPHRRDKRASERATRAQGTSPAFRARGAPERASGRGPSRRQGRECQRPAVCRTRMFAALKSPCAMADGRCAAARPSS